LTDRYKEGKENRVVFAFPLQKPVGVWVASCASAGPETGGIS